MTLILSVLALFAAAKAEIPSANALRTQDPAIRARFEEGIAKYVDGQYEDAEVVFRQLDVETGLSAHDREILSLMVGKCLYAQQAYLDCKRYFERFLTRHPDTHHESAIRIIVGHCYYQLRDYERAAMSYATAMTSGPQSHRDIAKANLEPLVTSALRLRDLEFLLLGLTDQEPHNRIRLWIADRWYDGGWRQKAKDLYRQLSDASPQSETGRYAQERLNNIKDLEASTLNVAIMGPFSGDFADYGWQMESAALLARDQLEDGITLMRGDTGGDSARVTDLADSLVGAGCDVVIGPLVPAAIHGAATVFDREDIVQVLPLARRDDFTESSRDLYQMASPPANQGGALAEYATQTMGLFLLGILASDTPDGHAAAEAFAHTATSAGAKVYPPEFFTPGTPDFGEQLRRLKERCADSASKVDEEGEPADFSDWIPVLDGMLIWGDPEDFVLIVPQVVFHRFRVQYFGPAAWGETDAFERIHTALDSVTFTSHAYVDTTRAAWQDFARRYRSRWGNPPTSLSGRVYDLATWLGQAGIGGREQERLGRFLMRPEGHQGVTGKWRFDQDRFPVETPIYRYRNGMPIRVGRY